MRLRRASLGHPRGPKNRQSRIKQQSTLDRTERRAPHDPHSADRIEPIGVLDCMQFGAGIVPF